MFGRFRKKKNGRFTVEELSKLSTEELLRLTSREVLSPELIPAKQEPSEPVIEEPVSAVFRRQIPPRPDREIRSWLGGLPVLPDNVAWPRKVLAGQSGARPLHFLAQIACADLPDNLWGGLGPRTGWLLIFIDPNNGCPEGPEAFEIIHTTEKGAERNAPADLGPVYDGAYTGPDYSYCAPKDIPNVWRRWPVDIVKVPNRLVKVDGRMMPTPRNFARKLYPDTTIADDHGSKPGVVPYSWGSAVRVLESLDLSLAKPKKARQLQQYEIDHLLKPGQFDALIVDEAEISEQQSAREAKIAALPPEQQAEKLEQSKRWFEMERKKRAYLQGLGSAQALLDDFAKRDEALKSWQTEARQALQDTITSAKKFPSEAEITPEQWAEIRHALDALSHTQWDLQYMRSDYSKLERSQDFVLHERKISLLNPQIYDRSGLIELAADAYVSQVADAPIPKNLSELEAWWRRLRNNRPHRMGGFHDGLQSEAGPSPTNSLLLLQIATDDAMNWCWGDSGVYLFWITPNDLEALNFSNVEMHLESH